MKKNKLFEKILDKVKPSKDEINNIKVSLNQFLKKLKEEIRKSKIDAEIFVGGSFAKNTLIKTKAYDVDIFIRFKDRKESELSKLTKKFLKKFKKETIHGSRDYFLIKLNQDLYAEIIPVKKVNNPKNSENTTDLSYSHVNYIRKKIKSEKILDEVRIAKAFFHANKCYGAESYINGFSGYGLELLIYYYGDFEKMLKAFVKSKFGEKIVIDIEKDFKNKQEILMDLNGSKLLSPIILIDPTFRGRNVLAALSEETFYKLKKAAKDFLKNPSLNYFEEKKINFEKLRKNKDSIIIEIKTSKQRGDVAGTKLIKFYNHFFEEVKKYFKISKSEFEYYQESLAKFYMIGKNKKEIVHTGPRLKDEKNVKAFKKKHKKTFVKGSRIYAKEKINFTLNSFVENWKKDNKRKMKEMSIIRFEVV